MTKNEAYEEIAKLLRKANWIVLDAEFKYRQLKRGTNTSNDIFRKRMDEAEAATARAHNEFEAYLKKDPNLSSSTPVSLAVFPGEAANCTEASLALDLMKAQESQKINK